MPQTAEQDPRTYFAAERTFLAWIRTGLALMGVGFAVARFALFLRQMSAASTHIPMHGSGFSLWAGVAIVALGVLLLLASTSEYIRTVRALHAGSWVAGKPSRIGIALAGLLAVVGAAMACYLVALR